MRRELGKILLSPMIYVTICTVGGVDRNGNEIEEPVIFEGYYKDANKFFGYEKIKEAQRIFEEMPDGYITVEVGAFSREVYDASEIMDAIEEMI